MFIDPVMRQPCPKGVNPMVFQILQRLWWDERHVSLYTSQTMMRGFDFITAVQFMNNDGNHLITSL